MVLIGGNAAILEFFDWLGGSGNMSW